MASRSAATPEFSGVRPTMRATSPGREVQAARGNRNEVGHRPASHRHTDALSSRDRAQDCATTTRPPGSCTRPGRRERGSPAAGGCLPDRAHATARRGRPAATCGGLRRSLDAHLGVSDALDRPAGQRARDDHGGGGAQRGGDDEPGRHGVDERVAGAGEQGRRRPLAGVRRRRRWRRRSTRRRLRGRAPADRSARARRRSRRASSPGSRRRRRRARPTPSGRRCSSPRRRRTWRPAPRSPRLPWRVPSPSPSRGRGRRPTAAARGGWCRRPTGAWWPARWRGRSRPAATTGAIPIRSTARLDEPAPMIRPSASGVMTAPASMAE